MTSAEHFARLLDMPCIVTGAYGVTRHHILGGSCLERMGARGSRKHSDWLALPLLPELHQGPKGIHSGVETWEALHGTQVELIDRLGALLGLDLWALAEQEHADKRANRRQREIVRRHKPYVAPTKQLARQVVA